MRYPHTRVALALTSVLLLMGAHGEAKGSVSVKGYTRANGTYVAPYTRSSPGSGSYTSSSSSGTGIACGNSYISSSYNCNLSSGTSYGGTSYGGSAPPTAVRSAQTQMPIGYNANSQLVRADGSIISTSPHHLYFASCSEALKLGYHDMPYASPGYARELDRDQDGVACEGGGSDGNNTPTRHSPPGYTIGTPTEEMVVEEVIDGRTVVLKGSGPAESYTLLGLDVPKKEGKGLLANFLPVGTSVMVELQPDSSKIYLWKNLQLINWEMLSMGSPSQEMPSMYTHAAELNALMR